MTRSRLIRMVPLTILLFSLLLTASCRAMDPAPRVPAPHASKTKNLILMVVDGASASSYTLARWRLGRPLAVDPILTGGVATQVADSVIADSAAAASAFAAGAPVQSKQVSVSPAQPPLSGFAPTNEADPGRPLATLLEGARLSGRAVGLAVTCRVSHATPAAFYAHVPRRYQEDDIMEQAVYQGLDVVLGGGMRGLFPEQAGGKRKDGEDLSRVLAAKGYTLARNRAEMNAVTSGRLYGLFAKSHMAAELDRPQIAPDEPTLAEMAAKALQLLSQDPDGFFLLVEASQVDWANHANDPAYLLGEMTAFDQAAAVALEFTRRHPDTLLVVLSDHATGGMSLGNARSDLNYAQTSIQDLLAPLAGMRVTAHTLWFALPEKTPAALKKGLSQYWGIDLSDQQAAEILRIAQKAKKHPKQFMPYFGIGEVVSREHTIIGWTTHGHVGDEIPLYALGPGAPHGLMTEPQIGRHLAKTLGLDLRALNARLFQDAAQAFGPSNVTIDQSQPHNPVLVIKYQNRTARLPINKNLLLLDGKTHALEGLVVWNSETQKAYLPTQAVLKIKE